MVWLSRSIYIQYRVRILVFTSDTISRSVAQGLILPGAKRIISLFGSLTSLASSIGNIIIVLLLYSYRILIERYSDLVAVTQV